MPLSERGRDLQTVSARLMASSSDDVGSEKERFEVQHLALARWPTPGTQRARKLWQAELEFVQSLANPEYLHCAPTRSPRALATPPSPKHH